MFARHVAKSSHLSPDRGLVHPKLLEAFEAAVEVPHDPEADHVLDHLTAKRLQGVLDAGLYEGGRATVHRIDVGLPRLLG